MNKTDVISFFDQCAPWWDEDMVRNEELISTILDNAGIHKGLHVLDVACGTGVLFPDYLKRDVASITGIDISPEMVKIAQTKFPQVNVVCADVETVTFDRKFDAIMVYNAFPHFPDPAHLIQVLAEHILPGGRLSIAHGMSRSALISHHAGRASTVSIDLLHEDELAEILEPYFEVDVIISNEKMYQVAGTRRETTVPVQTKNRNSHPHRRNETPLDELLALMKYMVSHNDAHAQEMATLAGQLKDAGKFEAYNKIMDVVSDFDILNAKFDAVLKELQQDLT